MQCKKFWLFQSLHQKAVSLEKSLSETLKKLKRYREKTIFNDFMVNFSSKQFGVPGCWKDFIVSVD